MRSPLVDAYHHVIKATLAAHHQVARRLTLATVGIHHGRPFLIQPLDRLLHRQQFVAQVRQAAHQGIEILQGGIAERGGLGEALLRVAGHRRICDELLDLHQVIARLLEDEVSLIEALDLLLRSQLGLAAPQGDDGCHDQRHRHQDPQDHHPFDRMPSSGRMRHCMCLGLVEGGVLQESLCSSHGITSSW